MRRWLVVALVLAAALCAVGVGLLLAVAVSSAVLVVAVGVLLRRRPLLAATARLLDERLALSERLATAWELEGAGRGGDLLAARVIAEAEGALASSLVSQRARAVRARHEWLAVVVAAVIVAVVALLVGGSSGGSAGSAGAGSHAGHGRGAAGAQSQAARRAAARRRAGRGGANTGGAFSGHNPYSNGNTRRIFDEIRKHPHVSYTAPGLRPDITDASSAPLRTDTGGGGGGSQSSSSDGTLAAHGQSGADGSAGGSRAGSDSEIAPVTRPSSATANGTAGSPGAGGGNAAAPPSAGNARPPAGGRGGQSTGGGQRGTSSNSTATGGAPTGGGEAGHQRGSDQPASSAPDEQTQGSLGLSLQGELAPGRPGGGHAKPGDEGDGGGGRSRSGQVTGPGGTAGGAFPYIPSASSPLGRDQQGLLLNYLRELTVLAGRSW
ncbi:MAG TPA: hypothetical protein VGM91_05155 [Conexibacter sp.]|jgi:hypothetical protein